MLRASECFRRGNILPLMVNQYFTEGISVIRGTQVQKVRLYVCGSNPSRFFPFKSRGNTFALSDKSILLNFSLFVLISVIRDT